MILWMKPQSVTTQMKATEQYYTVGGDSTFESVDETLKCDHSYESCWAIFTRGAFCVSSISNWKSSNSWEENQIMLMVSSVYMLCDNKVPLLKLSSSFSDLGISKFYRS